MRIIFRTSLLRVATGAVAVALLAAGCSGSDSDTDSATTETTTTATGAGEFDADAVQDVLLTQEDVPDGYTEVSQAELTATLGQVSGSLDQMLAQMQVEPAECQADLLRQIGQMADMSQYIEQGAVALFISGTDAISQSIMPEGTVDLATAYTLGEDCSNLTINIAGVTGEATIEPIDIGDLGDEAFANRTTMAVEVGGQQISTVSGSAAVKSGTGVVTVATTKQGDADPSAVDAELTELITTAVEKAEPAL